jgi:hypothetical protein
MNFREFLEYEEIFGEFTDPRAEDISQIEFEPVAPEFKKTKNPMFSYKFEFGGNKFWVMFEEKKLDSYMMKPFEIVGYAISFYGPQQTKSTGMAGASAGMIYKKLILAIRKWLETHRVDFLSFLGQEPKMDLVYDSFYTRFLQQDFIRTSANTYMKKSVLQDFLQKYPSVSQTMQKNIEDTKKQQEIYLASVREKAARDRNIARKAQNVGSFGQKMTGLLPSFGRAVPEPV